MKKLIFVLLGAIAIGACQSEREALPQGQEEQPAQQYTWTPPPPPKQPAAGQKCLINERSCEEVIKVLQQPDAETLLKAWDIEIKKVDAIRTGTKIFTLGNGVTITTPSSVPPVDMYAVRLEDNTEFLFSKYELNE